MAGIRLSRLSIGRFQVRFFREGGVTMAIEFGEDEDVPSVGEWWVNKNNKRMFIAGTTSDGKFILEFPSGEVYVDHGDWRGCYQLFGCDSWDWVEQPVFCGDGYRFIDVKEDSPEKGDEIWNASKQRWQVRSQDDIPFDKSKSAYRRKEKMTAEPMESPDDWVVQDRVPARAGIDQGWFEYDRYEGEVSKGFWIVRDGDVGRSHGDRVNVSDEMATFELRCRRKDLPPPPAKKIPVRLWVSHRMTHETGADYPVRCGDQPPSGQGRWVEIHYSPDGFYLVADQ
jgi:hypothetical protein